jgi:hypothetical protein
MSAPHSANVASLTVIVSSATRSGVDVVPSEQTWFNTTTSNATV